ncbi:hypothetical protein [Sporosarcina sp. BP05]|uniref:hypothetical protein n=1 Tax=Sporosarcina sp. BP05 TaxID=2758726 RepID=UPI00164907CB|nr:hypothetical protein [Sporosarcina sp. BP05]
MLNTLRLEAIKLKRTSTSKLVIGITFFTVIVSGILASGFLVQNSMNWWYTLLYPLLTALVCSTIFGSLDKKHGFQPLFLSRIHMGKFFIAKSTVAGCIMFISSVLYCSLLLIVTLVLPTEFDWIQISSAIFVTWLGYLFLIPLCGLLMLYLPSLLVTICIVIGTEMMQMLYAQFPIWQLNPFITPAVIMTTIVNTLPNGLPNNGIMDSISILAIFSSLFISICYWFVSLWLGSKLLQRKSER